MRRPRKELPLEGVYHVTSRGVARTTTFRAPDEYRLFLRLLAHQVDGHDWRVHAFCLMPNHFHLVVGTQLWRLSDGMQRLSGRYAQAFNRRHKYWGHLFGERFASSVVRDDDHHGRTLEYVLQNPVRAGLVERAEDWPWATARGGSEHLFDRSATAKLARSWPRKSSSSTVRGSTTSRTSPSACRATR